MGPVHPLYFVRASQNGSVFAEFQPLRTPVWWATKRTTGYPQRTVVAPTTLRQNRSTAELLQVRSRIEKLM